MTAYALESLATQAALASVNLYRHHISPRKGFSCPHRLLHGGESCSDYVKRILTDQSLRAAIHAAPQRFKDCHTAAQNLTLSGSRGQCIVIPCCVPL